MIRIPLHRQQELEQRLAEEHRGREAAERAREAAERGHEAAERGREAAERDREAAESRCKQLQAELQVVRQAQLCTSVN